MAGLPFARVAIVGVGLLGGSLGAALRRRLPGIHVRGFGRDTGRLELAVRRGAVDDYRLDCSEGLADRDLVVLATPIDHIVAALEMLAGRVARDAVVTDVGSTKRAICARAGALLARGATFIGGHPIAGKEVTGIAHSDPDLFVGAPYVLCPGAGTEAALGRLDALVRTLGARPVILTPEAHDAAAAWISHLPQLLSTTLAILALESGIAATELVDLAGSGFRDMIRLAGSSHAVWKGILETNADNVDAALGAAIASLEAARLELRDGALETRFARAQSVHAAWRAHRENR